MKVDLCVQIPTFENVGDWGVRWNATDYDLTARLLDEDMVSLSVQGRSGDIIVRVEDLTRVLSLLQRVTEGQNDGR